MSVEETATIGLLNQEITNLRTKISSLTTDKNKLQEENTDMKKNLDSLTQKIGGSLEKTSKLSKKNTDLKSKIAFYQDEAISSKAKSRSVPSRIGDVILGFIIGFGFTFLIIFIMWFTSLFTESISDVYKEIFCSNKLK